MCENRHTKLCGNFQCRTRLRRIQQKIALRAFDQETAQTEIANGTFSLSGRPLAVIGIDGRQAVNAVWPRHDPALCKVRDVEAHLAGGDAPPSIRRALSL
jgi:hypothetical protein